MQVAGGTGDRDRHPGNRRAADLFGHAAHLCEARLAAVLPSGACCLLWSMPVPDVRWGLPSFQSAQLLSPTKLCSVRQLTYPCSLHV